MLALLTTLYGNNENEHDKVTFQLAAVDLDSGHLWPE